MPFTLTSPGLENGLPADDRCTRFGSTLSPQLDRRDPPGGTRSFALVMEDADAALAGVRHRTVFDIPAGRRHLPPGRSSGAGTDNLAHAFNDFGNLHYEGPEPPPGDPPHHYRFRLAALKLDNLPVGDRPTGREVWEAARPHIIAKAELAVTCARPQGEGHGQSAEARQ